MPSLKDMGDLLDNERVIAIFTAPRPEKMDLRTLEGTRERLKGILEAGVGSSQSEVAHIAIQVGLFSLEEIFLKDPKE